MAELPDYYVTLEVKEDATLEDIKKAYKKLVLKHHPDRVPGEKDGKDKNGRFNAIKVAYECLSDETERRHYDDLRKPPISIPNFSPSGPSSESYNPGSGSYYPETGASNYHYNGFSGWHNYHPSSSEPCGQSDRPEYTTKDDNRRDSPRGYSKPSKKHHSREDQAEPIRTKSQKHRSGTKHEGSRSKGAKEKPYIEEYDEHRSRKHKGPRAKGAKEEPYIEEYDEYPSSPLPSTYQPRAEIAIPPPDILRSDLVYYTRSLFAETYKIDMNYRWLDYCWREYIDRRDPELRDRTKQALGQIAANIGSLQCWYSHFHDQTSHTSKRELRYAVSDAQQLLSEARAVARDVIRAAEVLGDIAIYRLNYETDRVSGSLQQEFVRKISRCRPLTVPPCQPRGSISYSYTYA